MQFVYNSSLERRKTILFQDGELIKTKYFLGSYEKEITTEGQKKLHYIPTPEGIVSVYQIDENEEGSMFYLHKDHLGSITQITDEAGDLVQSVNYNAWGVRKIITDNTGTDEFFLDRGYTGHEHLQQFKIINMNGRLYDPILARFLSPDNNVQMPDNTQNLNRYSYALNNPLKYTDPSGDFIVAAFVVTTAATVIAGSLYFTDNGYELQKYVSPIAFKFDIHLGTEKRGIGADVWVGIPRVVPISVGYHAGATYYSKFYGAVDGTNYKGWEFRYGTEYSLLGIVSLSNTHFKMQHGHDWNQTTSRLMLGVPYLSIQYENDFMFNGLFGLAAADEGDRWRSAAFRFSSPIGSVGVNMATGDPGFTGSNRAWAIMDGHYTYINTGMENYPDKYRGGLSYYQCGFVKIGINSETSRHLSQNKFAHDRISHGKSKWFRVMSKEYPDKFYFYIGTGTGSTLW